MNVQTPVRTGEWMQTATGKQFWPMDPRPEEIDIVDIAHALSNQCRYAGHCREFYSVAQHSVLVSRALEQPFKRWGLLHDASEAFLIDVPRPLKPYLSGYTDAEARVMDAVATRFNLAPSRMPEEIKAVDNAILVDEMTQLMAPAPAPWNIPADGLGIEITPWSPKVAYDMFLAEYIRLA